MNIKGKSIKNEYKMKLKREKIYFYLNGKSKNILIFNK